MVIQFKTSFKKNFNKRIKSNRSLCNKYKQRLLLFMSNSSSPILKDHGLIGKMKDFRSFSITGDIRVIYQQESEDIINFIDIGSHNQVYNQ